MKKKFLALLLAFVMVVGMLPMAAFAAEGDTAGTDPIKEALGVVPSNGVYTLTQGVTLSDTLTIDRTATIDLNGQTLTAVSTASGIIVSDGATLTIRDNTAVNPTVGSAPSYAVSGYQGGKITSEVSTSNGNLIHVRAGGTLNVESGCLENTKGQAISLVGNQSGDKHARVSISGGYIRSQETAIVPSTNSEVYLTGGVVEGLDNFAVSGNGTKNADGTAKYGPITVSITGGILIGRIVSTGYASCAVYMPTSGSVTVGGSAKVISTNGPGIVFRGGEGAFTVDGGEIIANGTQSGQIGDFKTGVECAAVVLDATADHYPDNANTRVQIAGGSFTADSSVPVVLLKEPDGGEVSQEFNITGGTFSSDPFANVTNITKPADYKYNTETKMVELDLTSAEVQITVDNSTEAYWQGDSVVTNASALIEDGNASPSGSTIKVTGTAKYITGWEAFNGTDVSEQSGNYLPLRIKIADGTASSKNVTELVKSVTVTGSKTKVFDDEKELTGFFDGTGDKANSGVLIMRLNNLIDNVGLANGHFQIKIEFQTNVEAANASKAADATKGAEVVYDIDCTGIILEMPKIPSGTVSDDKATLTFTDETKTQVATDITNTINAVAAPNDTEVKDESGEAPVVDNKSVTIPFDATSPKGTTTEATVTLPTEVVSALQGTDAAKGVNVTAQVKTDAAIVELPVAAISKLSTSDGTEIKVVTMDTAATSGAANEIPVPTGDTNATNLKNAVDSAVDVTVKCGSSSEPFKGNTDGAAAIKISIKVSGAGTYYVLYFSSTAVEKMTANAISAEEGSDGNYYVTFTSKHLSVFGAVPSNENTNKLVEALKVNGGADDQEQVTGALKITMSNNPVNGLYEATVSGLDTKNTYTIQISRGTNTAPAVIFTLKPTNTSMVFSVNAGSVINIWTGAVTITNGVPSSSTSPVTATAGA